MLAQISLLFLFFFLNSQLCGMGDIVFNVLDARGVT
jgi:hypothetical protein